MNKNVYANQDVSIKTLVLQHDVVNSELVSMVNSRMSENIHTRQHAMAQTGMTKPVPARYLTASKYQGKVVRLDYDSKDYVRDSAPISKTAYIYLPYSYDDHDKNKRYNIIYLMHGFGGHAGEYFDFGNNRNMFDKLIENGDMPPSIIVSATFYTKNSATDFTGSIRELRAFHHDFENNLMPAVEGKFNTYATSTSKEHLAESRDHRAFGGFSLGSVTTWLEFCYDYNYIRYFLPMSGSSWYFGTFGNYYPVETSDFFEELIKENNLNERGYFIYVATGTLDIVRDQVEIQMKEMLNRANTFTSEHVVYYQKQNGKHDLNAVQEYLFNALPLFFK